MGKARVLGAAALMAAVLVMAAAPAAAQDPNPNQGAVTFSGGIDFLNAYHFRGIPQDETGVIMWPWGDVGFALYDGDGGVTSVGVNVGTWNSLHTGDAGSGTPGQKIWYESDFYTSLGLGFAGGTSLGVTYTAYTSPNGVFGTVKELAFSFAVDDSEYLGGAALAPSILLARELDGQADGGREEGTYLELGIEPGYAGTRASLAVPVKLGLSVGDYYELDGVDQTFGFFSIGAAVTVPFTSAPTRFGSWDLHGGIEYLRLGDSNQGFGENQVVGSVGIALSY
jgi:hypothetical protein